jgi:peptidoglycan-associated lipoprotein
MRRIKVKEYRMKWAVVVLAMATILTISACKKKVAPAPPPPPPAVQAPTASLTANPVAIQQGQSSTLSWTTQNATEITLEGIGRVGPSGSQLVVPSTSTTYRLTAKGAGGTQEATARITVTSPPPATSFTPSATEQELFARSVKDIYFNYDSYELRASDQPTLQADAAFLKSHSNIRFTLEGHCDERGSIEYNLALGENRANSFKQTLVNLGIPASSIKTISYGKEKPICTEHNEACWQQNRRAHFAYGQ